MKLNDIKDKMDSRTIAPSAGSWDTLAKRLDAQQASKKPTYIYWIGAIAAVLMIAFVLYPVITPAINPSIEDAVVNKEKSNSTESQPLQQLNVIPDNAVATQNVADNKETAKKQPVAQTKSNPSTAIAAQSKKYPVADSSPESKNTKKPQQKAITPAASLATIAFENEIKPTQKMVLTPAQEADLLLKKAMGTVKSANSNTVTANSVRPDRLLMEAEWDVQASMRNKIDNILLDQFGKLKAQAVALIDKK